MTIFKNGLSRIERPICISIPFLNQNNSNYPGWGREMSKEEKLKREGLVNASIRVGRKNVESLGQGDTMLFFHVWNSILNPSTKHIPPLPPS